MNKHIMNHVKFMKGIDKLMKLKVMWKDFMNNKEIDMGNDFSKQNAMKVYMNKPKFVMKHFQKDMWKPIVQQMEIMRELKHSMLKNDIRPSIDTQKFEKAMLKHMTKLCKIYMNMNKPNIDMHELNNSIQPKILIEQTLCYTMKFDMGMSLFSFDTQMARFLFDMAMEICIGPGDII